MQCCFVRRYSTKVLLHNGQRSVYTLYRESSASVSEREPCLLNGSGVWTQNPYGSARVERLRLHDGKASGRHSWLATRNERIPVSLHGVYGPVLERVTYMFFSLVRGDSRARLKPYAKHMVYLHEGGTYAL